MEIRFGIAKASTGPRNKRGTGVTAVRKNMVTVFAECRYSRSQVGNAVDWSACEFAMMLPEWLRKKPVIRSGVAVAC